MCPIVRPKLHAVPSARQLRHRDERPFHSRNLEPQGTSQALGGAESCHLLTKVREARAIGGTVAASGALHGRLLHSSWKQPWRSHGLLGTGVDHGCDRPPASLGLVKAAETRLAGPPLNRKGGQPRACWHPRGTHQLRSRWIAAAVQDTGWAVGRTIDEGPEGARRRGRLPGLAAR